VEGDRAPKQAGANLYRHMASVVRIPDPDLAAILHDALIRGRLHANGLEGSGGSFDLFLAFDLHRDSNGAHGIGKREAHILADKQRLRCSVKNSGKRIGDAGRNRSRLGFRSALHQILFRLGLLALGRVEAEVAGDFAPSLLQLFAEAGRAAGLDVEGGLKRIDNGKQHRDPAYGIGRRRNLLKRALLFKVEDSGPGGEDTPVDGKSKGLPLRKDEARQRRLQHRDLRSLKLGLLGRQRGTGRQHSQEKREQKERGRITLGQRQLTRVELFLGYRFTNSRRAANAA